MINPDFISAPSEFPTHSDPSTYYCYAYDNRYLFPELAGEHGLPHYCFSVLPSTGKLIRIERGEKGYFLCNTNGQTPQIARWKANDENVLRGITRAQEEAMLAGSMFGWDSPAAKPWHYDKDGVPRTPQPKNRGSER